MKTKNSKEYLDNLRHSCAHLLAAAVMELWPKTKRTIGPSIEDGFYFDFDFGDVKISELDLEKIEKKMRDLAPKITGFKRDELNSAEAKKAYPENEFKHELIDEFTENGKKKVSFYESVGIGYSDLCRGGHVEKPNEEIKHFKLLSVAGAYWRGSEKNKMLTRIYGTCWPTEKELIDFVEMKAEAEKRNHKKIGRELELFIFHETAPGMAYFLPKGVTLYNELISFWREEHKKYNYQEIVSPLINKKELYITSGHWDHYREDMFLSETEEGETYAMKPMNCPNAMVVFGFKTRSYNDLPLRLSDTDTLHRNEKSGVLNGLLRVREFRQDDAHIFARESQIAEVYGELFEITEKFYSIFGLEYSFRLGTRPEKFMGDSKLWDKAEAELKDILEKSKKEFSILEGDGAFYGPKIDILMKDSLGRSWQMGTMQLDFQIPRNFKLSYTEEDGSQQTPVVIHRVIYGSLERFIGIITEHFAGAFPVWLSPVQVRVLPITDRNLNYADELKKKLIERNIRVEVDSRSETLQAKIRDAQLEKVPYMVVVGDKEEKSGELAVRDRSGNSSQFDLDGFIAKIKKEIDERSNL